jgi:CDP-diacylglycerol---glycerol-3-phosphate 3-phosphatidyltransferase
LPIVIIFNNNKKSRMFNIPNTLTLLRIVMIPVLVLVLYLPYDWKFLAAAVIFAAAAATDWLDGYLARKLNQHTPFGAFLDPVADKLMVAAALVVLVELYAQWWFSIPAAIIIGREIAISALREWMAELGKRTSVAVSYVGKVKTVAQMSSVTVLLAAGDADMPMLKHLGIVMLYVAAGLTIWSMTIYLRAAWPVLSGRE